MTKRRPKPKAKKPISMPIKARIEVLELRLEILENWACGIDAERGYPVEAKSKKRRDRTVGAPKT